MYVPKDLADELRLEIAKTLRRKQVAKSYNRIFKPSMTGDDIFNEAPLIFGPSTIVQVCIEPTEKSIYWRFGFRFSKSGWPLMPPQRTATGYPLWHLTMNDNAKLVGSTYYNVDNVEDTTEGMIISPYKFTPILISAYTAKLEKEAVIRLVVEDLDKEEIRYVKNLPLSDHKFAWIASWGDQYDYSIDADITIHGLGDKKVK